MGGRGGRILKSQYWVSMTHGSPGQCVSFSLIDVGSGFTAYVVFLFFSLLGFMKFVSSAIQTRMHNLTSRNLSPQAIYYPCCIRLWSRWEVHRHAHTGTSSRSPPKIQRLVVASEAKSTGLHRDASRPLQSSASELVGLYVHTICFTKLVVKPGPPNNFARESYWLQHY